jgi:hypothetical protein
MNRTFRYKIGHLTYVLLTILGLAFLYSMWTKQIIVALCFVVFHLYVLERSLHTSYTITQEGDLIFRFGRFHKAKRIALTTITEIQPIRILPFGKYHLYRYLLITCGHQHYTAMVDNEEEFLRCIERKRENQ